MTNDALDTIITLDIILLTAMNAGHVGDDLKEARHQSLERERSDKGKISVRKIKGRKKGQLRVKYKKRVRIASGSIDSNVYTYT